MRWWRLRRRRSQDVTRADQAIADTEQQHQQVKHQRGEVDDIEHGLRRLREHNHFADAIRRALEGR